MSVPRSIETSELNTLTCNVKETDVTMCDGRRRKYKKHGKQCVVFCTNRKNCLVKKKYCLKILLHITVHKYLIFVSLFVYITALII